MASADTRRRAFALIATMAGLLVGEAAFRAVFPLPGIANFNRVSYAELRRGVLDQPPLMNASFRWSSEPDRADFVHRLNLYGFRDTRTWSVRPDPSRRRVMFLGDSFVEGMMAEDHETIPAVYGAATGAEAMNLGMGGTGLGHYVRLAAVAVPLFRPQTIVVILYANDLPPPALDTLTLAPGFQPHYARRTVPRVLQVMRRAASGEPVPRRWHTAPFSFFGAVPDPTNPLTDRAPGYEPLVEPALLDAMKRGAFNPYLSDHVQQSAEALRAPADVRPHLEALAALARRHQAELRIAYLPHSLQVSDHYMAFARRYSVLKPVDSMTGPEFQRHAAHVAATCRAIGLPFFDLTPAIRAEENAGRHLYWDYDNHMRAAGYAFVATRLAEWSSPSR